MNGLRRREDGLSPGHHRCVTRPGGCRVWPQARPGQARPGLPGARGARGLVLRTLPDRSTPKVSPRSLLQLDQGLDLYRFYRFGLVPGLAGRYAEDCLPLRVGRNPAGLRSSSSRPAGTTTDVLRPTRLLGLPPSLARATGDRARPGGTGELSAPARATRQQALSATSPIVTGGIRGCSGLPGGTSSR